MQHVADTDDQVFGEGCKYYNNRLCSFLSPGLVWTLEFFCPSGIFIGSLQSAFLSFLHFKHLESKHLSISQWLEKEVQTFLYHSSLSWPLLLKLWLQSS